MKRGRRAPSSLKNQQAFSFCLRLFIIGGLGIALLVNVMLENTGYEAISLWHAYKPWLAYWRLGLCLGLIGGWPYWIKRYACWAKLEPEQQQGLSNFRWRFAFLLLVIEVILVRKMLVEAVS